MRFSKELSRLAMCVPILLLPGYALSFQFYYPETRLVEESLIETGQNEVTAAFDLNGNIHAVWHDLRLGPGTIFGNTMLRSRDLLGSYMAYELTGTYPVNMPSILLDGMNPNRMFVIGNELFDPNLVVGSSYDLTYLPGSVNSLNIPDKCILPAGFIADDLQAVWTMDKITFCFEYAGYIYLGEYTPGFPAWSLVQTLVPPTGHSFLSPLLATDDEGYIYICYNLITDIASRVQARRSIAIGTTSAGFHPARLVEGSGGTSGYLAAIATTGRYSDASLYVSFLCVNQNLSFKSLRCTTEHQGIWVSDLNVTGSLSVLTMSEYFGGMDIQFDPAGRLYTVWTDNHLGQYQLFGSISYDKGLSFTSDQPLHTHGLEVIEKPCLSIGSTPGNIAVTYLRSEGGGHQSPFMLASLSEFYDSCDLDPAVFWDGYTGVQVDTTLFHGLTGTGGSYRLETEDKKGSLIRDYGSIEMTGIVELHFYDSLSEDADFMVVLNNDNAKGVIRMLGVRNDTSNSNYVYFDGTQDVIWGGPRSVGWHHVIVTVNDNGITMQLETSPGFYLTTSPDSAFTAFTSILIEGGSDTDPYNVDDVRIETVPGEITPLPIPVESPFLLIFAIVIVSAVLIRARL